MKCQEDKHNTKLSVKTLEKLKITKVSLQCALNFEINQLNDRSTRCNIKVLKCIAKQVYRVRRMI